MFENNAMESIVNLESLIDLLIESKETEKPLHAGGCVAHRVIHPNYGNLLLIETPTSNECIALKV